MKSSLLAGLVLLAASFLHAVTLEPEVAELSFDTRWADAELAKGIEVPSWIVTVRQEGGVFLDEPRCWRVDAAQPPGEGFIEIAVDRSRIVSGNLVATLLFDADEDADVAVQLFDSQGRVVVVDLFGNVVDIGMQATTDTFVVPLSRYPTADRIVIRRVSGGMRLHGVVLFPVITEGPMEKEALQELARVLGDPLSPENPLVPSIQRIAQTSEVAVASVKSVIEPVGNPADAYPGAQPVDGPDARFAATDGLLVHYDFDQGDAVNCAASGGEGEVRVGASFVKTERGHSLRLRSRAGVPPSTRWDAVTLPVEALPKLHDRLSLCAWIKGRSIGSGKGAQILWYGDRRSGRDPWTLNLLGSGRAEFRSDRSITGQPQFVVNEKEIVILPGGKAHLTQHVSIRSQQKLAPEQWYFLVATMDMLSARTRTMRLYVNGELVNELQTPEEIDYDTDGMWATIGAANQGEGQNFDGDIDDVRIYDLALSPEEVRALYLQPWN